MRKMIAEQRSWSANNGEIDNPTINASIVYRRSFLMTVLDISILPFLALSLLSPIRWRQLLLIFYAAQQPDHSVYDHHWTIRTWLFAAGFGALRDLLTIPLVIICYLSPTRRINLIRDFVSSFEDSSLEVDELRKYAQYYDILGYLIISCGIKSIFEVLFLVPTFSVSILMPSVWPGLFSGLRQLGQGIGTFEYNSFKERLICNYRWHSDLRAHMMMQVLHVLVDVIVLPFYLIALISPMRSSTLRSQISELVHERRSKVAEDALNGYSEAIGTFEYGYIYQIRRLAMQSGLLALADVVFFPMAIPLFLARYRFNDIREDVAISSSILGFKQICLVTQQFLFLFLDMLVLLPLIPLLYVTQLRWGPVSTLLSTEKVFRDKSWKIYETVLYESFLLSLDVMCVPFILVICLTVYRISPVRTVWSEKPLWSIEFLFHKTILANFFIILHDVIFLWPVVLLTASLSFVRLPILIELLFLQSKWGSCFSVITDEASTEAAGESMASGGLNNDNVIDNLGSHAVGRRRHRRINSGGAGSSISVDDLDVDYELSDAGSGAVPTRYNPAFGGKGLSVSSKARPSSELVTLIGIPSTKKKPVSNTHRGFLELNSVRSSSGRRLINRVGGMLATRQSPGRANESSQNNLHLAESESATTTDYRQGSIATTLVTATGLVNHDNGRDSSRQSPLQVRLLTGSAQSVSWLVPGLDVRVAVWRQLANAVIDIPFLVMGLLILCTGWRSGELWSFLKSLLEESESIKHFIIYFEADIRQFVLAEFILLLRDLLCVVPIAVITATLYRLPQLVANLVRTFHRSGPLREDPVFDIVKCNCSIPDKGPAQLRMTLNCRESIVNRNEVFRFLPDSVVTLHVVGDILWEHAVEVHGSEATSLLRYHLPLKLKNDRDVHMSEFREEYEERLMLALNAQADEEQALSADVFNVPLWMQLDSDLDSSDDNSSDFEKLIRKLKEMPPDDTVALQFETVVGTTANLSERKRVVLCQMSPTIQELLSLLNDGNGNLSDEALDMRINHDNIVSSNILTRAALALQHINSLNTNFVNTFSAVVMETFWELANDVACSLMILLLLLSPYRFLELAKLVFDFDALLPFHIGLLTYRAIRHTDRHIIEYRREVNMILNNCVKDSISLSLNFNLNRDDFIDFHGLMISRSHMHALELLEKTYLKPYTQLISKQITLLHRIDGCEPIASLLRQRVALQEELIKLMYLRCAAAAHQSLSTEQFGNNNLPSNGSQHYPYVAVLMLEERDMMAKALAQNFRTIYATLSTMKRRGAVQATNQARRKLSSRAGVGGASTSSCWLTSKPWHIVVKLIYHVFFEALYDISYTILIVILALSIVRTVPLFKELFKRGSLKTSDPRVRFSINKQLVHAIDDVQQLWTFLCSSMVILCTVMSAPSFLREVYSHPTAGGHFWGRSTSTLYDCAQCARRHIFQTYRMTTEAILLSINWNCYPLLLRAFVYGVFYVPVASLAEACPPLLPTVTPKTAPKYKFIVGLLVWIGYLAGSAAVSGVARLAGQQQALTQGVSASKALLWIGGALFGTILVSAILMIIRNRHKPATYFDVAPSAWTWSHLLAVVTGPLESLQLSAVILFFFWSDDGTFGQDPFSSVALLWGKQSALTAGYFTATAVAFGAVALWAILIALPLAISSSPTNTGDSVSQRRKDLIALKCSPTYEFLMIMITRLFPVWIMATLMRSSSCVSVSLTTASAVTANSWMNVITTDERVLCGGGSSWAPLAAIPILSFYVITSTIFHTDDYDLSRFSSTSSTSIRFAPIYAKSFRAVQFFVCIACLGGFWTNDVLNALVPIMVVVGLLVVVPLFVDSSQLCSWPIVIPLRAAGCVCVLWTATVCFVRSRSDVFTDALLPPSYYVLIGWVLIYVLVLMVARRIELQWLQQQKREILTQAGFANALDKLAQISEILYADDIAYGRSTTKANYRARYERFRKAIFRNQSVKAVAHLFLVLEMDANVDRLSTEFFRMRFTWLQAFEALLVDDMRPPMMTLPAPVEQENDGIVGQESNISEEQTNSGMESNTAGIKASVKLGSLQLAKAHNQQLSAHRDVEEGWRPSVNLSTVSKYSNPLQTRPPLLSDRFSIGLTLCCPSLLRKQSSSLHVVQLRRYPSLQAVNDLAQNLFHCVQNQPPALALTNVVTSTLASCNFPVSVTWRVMSYLVTTSEFRNALFATSNTYRDQIPVRNKLSTGNKNMTDGDDGVSAEVGLGMGIGMGMGLDDNIEYYGLDDIPYLHPCDRDKSILFSSLGNSSISPRNTFFTSTLFEFGSQFVRARLPKLQSIDVSLLASSRKDTSGFRTTDNIDDEIFEALYKVADPGNESTRSFFNLRKMNSGTSRNGGGLSLHSRVNSSKLSDLAASDDFLLLDAESYEASIINRPDDDDASVQSVNIAIEGETAAGSSDSNDFDRSNDEIVEASMSITALFNGSVNYSDGSVYTGQMLMGGTIRHGRGKYVDAQGSSYYEGQWQYGQRHGFGMLVVPGVYQYEGEWKHGKKCGTGFAKYADGEGTYQGAYLNDKKHGKGFFKLANGDQYEGEYKFGLPHGVGVYKYRNNNRYEGEFVAGVKEGQGTLHYSGDDAVYVGQFKNDLKDGVGTQTFKSSGACYYGHFKAGAKSGNGQWTLPHGVYSGEVEGGLFHGRGVMKYNSGGCFDGQWVQGKRHGYGEFTDEFGNTWKGQWDHGKKQGDFATIVYKNGDIYSGQLKDGKRHGQGTFQYTSAGDEYIGEWQDDKKNGYGRYRYKNMDEYEGVSTIRNVVVIYSHALTSLHNDTIINDV